MNDISLNAHRGVAKEGGEGLTTPKDAIIVANVVIGHRRLMHKAPSSLGSPPSLGFTLKFAFCTPPRI